ncbi:Fe(3+)-hydroxamate ABC transporter permease FhuB [Erwinia sp. Leaf53]|uniref:Fe(3+)-hydroxamate ABC transporter permease FhuB n=1 Tax=Erwinia sp. Leaf53 TaxID=1736225 RepID=UPI0006FD8248|nr:Fe(3+)-hydroxamate ABC transporter permease FhuB [Erwinia sp. Leaf53]KQN56703.1 iron ABC transporter [Erwinia sp. Leaf53]
MSRSLLLLLPALALILLLINGQQQLDHRLWWQALTAPDEHDVRQMLFHFSLLPRTVLALLVGAGLGVAGTLFQQILRNPLAEPSTLGVAAGAQLGLTLMTLYAAGWGEGGQQLGALAGGLLAGGLVLSIAWGRQLSPVTLILAGLVFGLYGGAVKSLLALFNHDRLQNLFIWSSGMLNQYDWSAVQFLWPRMLVAGGLIALMIRPLALLGLDDGVVRNLGMRLALVRVAGLLLAVALSAMTVASVGVIGFIGLFAPILTRLLGVRRLASRLIGAALLGALLLLLSDQAVILLTRLWRELPTGAVTALLGAPLMLWLLPRLRHARVAQTDATLAVRRERHLNARGLLLLAAGLLLLVLLALFSGDGGRWLIPDPSLLQWRWPRVLAAAVAGAMLAAAGMLVQRMTGNPMASPEVLGVSSGAACAIVLLMFLVPGDISVWLLPAGASGAGLTLGLMVLLASRGGLSATRLLLVGIALSTIYGTLLTLFLASGDPRSGEVLSWLAGSTYRVTGSQALAVAGLALVLLAAIPLLRRWLTILPLGADTALSTGVPLLKSRLLILLLAAALIAAATLMIGPLSFVGLMAPHLARLLGYHRALSQLCVAILLGSAIMLLADWLGRVVIFPYQIPAGLLATFIGAPCFIWLLRQR